MPRVLSPHHSTGSISLAIHEMARPCDRMACVVVPDTLTAYEIESELKFFSQDPVLTFPDWETLPYDRFAPHRDIISKRIALLNQLPFLKKATLIVPISTLMNPVPPKEYIAQHSLVLVKKQVIHLEAFRESLIKNGYHLVSQVMGHGECSIRGSIIDLFPMGSDVPYRIDLFDNEIDSIRTFDPETQRSIDSTDSIHLMPAFEFAFSPESIRRFRENWREKFTGNPNQSPFYQAVSEGRYCAGLEYYLPLFFEAPAYLLDYLPTDAMLLGLDSIEIAASQYWDEIQERFTQLKHDIEYPLLNPSDLFLSNHDVIQQLNSFQKLPPIKPSKPLPDLTIAHPSTEPLKKLQHFLNTLPNTPILFCCDSLGRREHLFALLQSIQVIPTLISSWEAFLSSTQRFHLTVAPLQKGLWHETPPFCIITETELLGQPTPQVYRQKKRSFENFSDLAIRHLFELKIGDPIVHIDHGVGRFLGLQTLEVDRVPDEYLTIQYAENNKLYVPVSSLHLIHRYSGASAENAPLHHLGSEEWGKAKQKAAEKVRDTAAELLNLYAIRANQKGFVFENPGLPMISFEEGFPFEETPDQLKAIQAVTEDLCSEKIMDRLICGDVGFGKTEVAMRAAFLVVHNHKQVAILVPTTLLAEQHYNTFSDRFADYPIQIEMLSRFRSRKEQEAILEKLAAGKIDIIIGTHKLIQSDVHFQNLGLLVIDEEHRFGVRQKEQLKKLRANVDLLALTATPIPRTLNMALASIRDLSIIATPPVNRLSIKTFIHEKQDRMIREAILREILRGGQVFYLHNDVASIERCANHLEKLIPEARVQIAHGQMRERDLEQVMVNFYHRRFNVLVCSTIIESGIDIPSANTIIIERADKFGLAQLHQLRGRVGRSHHQAYAYLLIPSKKTITADALRRLEAIEVSDDLGIGFTLATYDLEIRGAGELLGENQSGHIEEVGFTLYMEMLERTIKALKSGKIPTNITSFDPPIEINLSLSAIIPENYLPDTHSRLVLYKRIASAKNAEELTDLRVEMIDRFGLLPPPTQNLFEIAELRLFAEKIGIKKLEAKRGFVKITFAEKNGVDAKKVLALIQKESAKFQLKGSYCLQCQYNETQSLSAIEFIKQTITRLLDNRIA